MRHKQFVLPLKVLILVYPIFVGALAYKRGYLSRYNLTSIYETTNQWKPIILDSTKFKYSTVKIHLMADCHSLNKR